MLNSIKEKLEMLYENVYYGLAETEIEDWNYVVYGRKNYSVDEKNNKDAKEIYFVAVVKEEYIPEGTAAEVIKTIVSIPGMRVTPGSHTYNYAKKGGTGMIVEVLEIEFYRPRKGR